MPNDDLGTAHGKIRIDYEDRGSDKASAAMIKMAAQMELMNKNLEKMAKDFKDADRALDDNTGAVKRASSAQRGYSQEIFKTHKSIRAFISDTRALRDDMILLGNAAFLARDKIRSFGKVLTLFNQAGSAGSGRGSVVRALSIALADVTEKTSKSAAGFANFGRLITRTFTKNEQSFAGMRSAVTLLGGAGTVARKKLLGINDAISNAPKFVQTFNKWGKALGLVAGAMTLVGAASGPVGSLLQKAFRSDPITKFFKAMTQTEGVMGRIAQKSMDVFGHDITSVWRKSFTGLEKVAGGFFDRLGDSSVGFGKNLMQTAKGLREFSKDGLGLVANAAVFTSSLKNMWGRLAWFFKLPKPLMAAMAIAFSRILPTALYGLGKALTFASNLVTGLWSAMQTLGGGLVVIPGLIASVGAAALGLAPLIVGLKAHFKDLFSDDAQKAGDAWAKLPDHLKPLGKALKDSVKQFKDFQVVAQTVGFDHIEDQIKSLTDTYMPLYQRGSLGIIRATRGMKDQLVDFFSSGQTQTAFSSIFANTAQSIAKIGDSIKPVAVGFREMSVVGAQFVNQMVSFGPVVAGIFNSWATANAQNGKMTDWMNNAAHGAYDLGKGLESATKGAYQILTLFKTNNGDDFLDRFRIEMAKLNQEITTSKIEGFLSHVRQIGQNMGQKKIEEAKDLFHSFSDAINTMIPFIGTLSNAFSGVFLKSMNTALIVVSNFTAVLNSIGATDFIGWILGAAAAVKLLPKWGAVAIDSIKGIGSAFFFMKNKDKVINALEGAFNTLAIKMQDVGGLTGKVGAGMERVSGTVNKSISVISGLVSVFSIVGVAALAFFSVYEGAQEDSEKFNQQMATNAKSLLDFRDALNKSFMDDKGMRGHNVMTTVTDGMNTMMSNLQATAQSAPGVMTHIKDFFKLMTLHGADQGKEFNTGFTFAEDSKDTNAKQEAARAAASASDEFDKLRQKGVDLNAVITASDSDFQAFVETQKALGQQGQDTINALTKQRAVYQALQKDFQTLGPAGVELADGVKKIAEAAGDATAKLDGMKKVLEALGILKTSALDATRDYEQGLDDLTNKVSSLIDEGGQLAASDLMSGGTFNLANQNGRDFYDTLEKLGDEFLANVSAGGDADKAYGELLTSLQKVSDQTGISMDDLKNLAAQVGAVPEVAKILVQVDGKDQATQDLFQTYLKMQQVVQTGIGLNVFVHPGDLEAVKNEINGILGRDNAVSVAGTNLEINPGLNAADMAKVVADLKKHGIDLDGTGLPGSNNAPNLPIVPGVAPLPQAPPPPAPPPPPPGAQLTPVAPPNGGNPLFAGPYAPDTTAIDAANAKIADLNKQISDLQAHPPNAPSADSFKGTVDAINGLVDSFNKAKDSIGTALAAIEDMIVAWSRNVLTPLTTMATSAYNDGAAIGNAFAQGLADSTNQAALAAKGIAQAVNDYIHGRSPTKKGPLSGDGWAENSGVKVGQAFASGISSTSGDVSGAASQVAGSAGAAFSKDDVSGNKYGGGSGAFLSQLSTLNDFGSHLVDVFSKLATTVLTFGKWISNPKGVDGQFFGKQLGWEKDKSITPKDLAEKNADAAQAAVSSAVQDGISNIGNKKDMSGALAKLDKNPTPQAAQAAFIQEATARGLGRDDIIAGLAAMQHESSSDQTQVNTDKGIHAGLFQMSDDKPGYKTAAGQIDWYLNNIKSGSGNPLQAAADLENGGYGGSALDASAAAKVYDTLAPQIAGSSDAIAAAPGTAGSLYDKYGVLKDKPPKSATTDTTDDINQNPQVASIVPQLMREGNIQNLEDTGTASRIGHGPPSEANMKEFAKLFGLTEENNATHGVDDGYHRRDQNGNVVDSGFGFDFTGDKDNMTKFAKFLQDNYSNQLLQLIHDSADGTEFSMANGRDVGRNTYYAKAGDHSGHVHVATDTGFGVDDSMLAKIQAVMSGSTGTPDYSKLTAEQLQLLNSGNGIVATTGDLQLEQMKQDDPALGKAISDLKVGTNIPESLEIIGRKIDTLTPADGGVNDNANGAATDPHNNPADRQAVATLKSIQSSAATQYGYKQKASPIDQALSGIAAGSNIASDVFGVIQSSIEAVGATKNIGDTLVRGISNTEEIYNMIDDVQKFIELGAKVASAVGDIASAAGSFTGGMDFGATSAVGQVASLVSGALEGVNAAIDLGQEVYRIVGSYVGQFLGFLSGGPDGALTGDVKYLLDTKTNQLLAYGADNPQNKVAHTLAGQTADPNARNQLIGNVNVYGGPGSDPRDMTRQMMFQVHSASMGQATGQ